MEKTKDYLPSLIDLIRRVLSSLENCMYSSSELIANTFSCIAGRFLKK